MEEALMEEALVEQPLWILLPWTVFGIAAGIKLWRLGTGLGRHLGGPGQCRGAIQANPGANLGQGQGRLN